MNCDLQLQAKFLLNSLKEKQKILNNFKTESSLVPNTKSVSFSDHIASSPRRRVRSASPRSSSGTVHLKIKSFPKKSILKKQFITNAKQQDRIVENISKSRQQYLSHVYEDNEFEKVELAGLNLSEKHWNFLFDNGNERVKTSSNKNDQESSALIRSISDNHLNHQVEINQDKNKKQKEISIVNSKNKKILKNKPLLGYDWIKDILDNKKNIKAIDKSDDYWNELINFRNKNKEECISNSSNDNTLCENDSRLNEDLDSFHHKCIHSYTLNERLFPVPTYTGPDGQSICPVCKSSRKDPTNYSPQFCKISIPQSRMVKNPLIIPQKRSNYDAKDTLALADHCVAGFNSKNPHYVEKSKNIDLKSASGVPNDYIKFTIDDLKKIASNKDPNAGIYNKGNAMRYELENQHQKRLRELVPKMNAI